MNFEEQHALYLVRCEQALRGVVERYFLPLSKVSQAAEYSLMNGGKRVRGILTLSSCELLGGDFRAADSYAAAIEMIHAFSLIHDDLPCMDDDDMRRGKPATHIAFGEAVALLAGDMLALEAFEVIAGAPFAAKQRIAAARTLSGAAGARGMAYGQELDLAYEQQRADEATLCEIHRNKTGALILAAVQLGVISADENIDVHPMLTAYAENLGLVFQIVDDILDETSTAEVLGKPIGSDRTQQKTTFVSLYGLEEARAQAARLTETAVLGLRQAYGEKAEFLCEYANRLAKRVS